MSGIVVTGRVPEEAVAVLRGAGHEVRAWEPDQPVPREDLLRLVDGADALVTLVTERVGKGVTWCPFHFAGWFQGVDQRGNYPKGADPIVLGESVNTLTTYGFDPVTDMQEPKATLCQVRAA